jgi:IclR family pca regulon transcriptional regulator
MRRRSISKAGSVGPEARYVVPGLQRGLAILGLFGTESPSLTLSEISRRVRLSRSTTFRLLYTLEYSGYLTRTSETGAFALTPRVCSLGFNFLSQLPVTQIAQPVLASLAENAQTAAHLVVLDGHEAVHIARVAPAAPIVSNLQIGTRRPAYAVASGRMLLAHMTEEGLTRFYRSMAPRPGTAPSLKSLIATARADRARGYAYSRTVYVPDLMSCAGAVLDHTAAAVAALTVIGPKRHLDSVLGERNVSALVCGAARQLSAKLGYQQSHATTASDIRKRTWSDPFPDAPYVDGPPQYLTSIGNEDLQ